MLNDETDEQLMALSAAGDRTAFDVLAGRYILKLRRAAMRVLPDAAAAEDAAQDALLRAWMRAATYDRKQANVSTWLHRIVVNAAIDRVRSARPTAELPETLLDPGKPRTSCWPGASATCCSPRQSRACRSGSAPPSR